MSILIRQETLQDYKAVENLTRNAFWNVYRPGCTEHFVLHKFRSSPNFIPELDLVMEKDHEPIGHVMYAKASITAPDGEPIAIGTFGPISIAPGYKRMGYGKQLLDASMQKAREYGLKALAITGDIAFYGKSGFVPASEKNIRYAFAEPEDTVVPYFLIKELEPGFLNGISGTYQDPEEYFAAEKNPREFSEYEAAFPYKEAKKNASGQLV